MKKLKDCLRVSKGIRIGEPSFELATAYVRKAREDLKVIDETSSENWKICASYYAMYHGLYAILQRIGIHCEIHACTHLIMRRLLRSHFTLGDYVLLKKGHDARVQAQYFVNLEIEDSLREKLIRSAPKFVKRCKKIVKGLSNRDILLLRSALKAQRAL